MMIISIAKALLVIIFFMHLKWETNWKYVLTIPAAVMSCLLVLVLIPDIGNRTQSYSAERQKFGAFELKIKEPLPNAQNPAARQPQTPTQPGTGKQTPIKNSASPPAHLPGENSPADGNWGVFKGQFRVRGEIPQPKAIHPDKDQNACQLPMVSRNLLISPRGELQNVVIFLVKPEQPLPIHPYYQQKMKQPVILDNHFCRFEPHIVLLATGQPLRVQNSDEVGHNANTSSFHDENAHNLAIPAGKSIDFHLPVAESRPIHVACTSHSWMKAHVMIRNEPYMAVSDNTGKFEIKYFPAGEWQVQFWHENAGYLTNCTAAGQTLTEGRKGLVNIVIPKNGVLDLGNIELDVSVVTPQP
jgi:hypothetical protein